MTEHHPYPKALYPSDGGAMVIVKDEAEHLALLEQWDQAEGGTSEESVDAPFGAPVKRPRGRPRKNAE